MKLATLILAAVAIAGAARVPRPETVPPLAVQYKARVIREAHAAGGLAAPVPMFAAQLHQESGWKNTAKSGVGAIGLAQFMPQSAAWIANVYPADLKPAAPFDADWAIRALVRYDFWLYQRVPKFQAGDQRWAAALAAYNGGLGWVLKDQKAATCDKTMWFDCVTNVPDERTLSNHKQSSNYPVRILLVLRPLYVKARWS